MLSRNMPLQYLLDENEYNFENPLEALQAFTVPFKIRILIRNVLNIFKCITKQRNFLFISLTYCDLFLRKNACLFSRIDIKLGITGMLSFKYILGNKQ